MSVREEEERRKKQCPSRGLGLAAAAIGVGVGAALYYYFNKRPEHPDGEGATSSNWSCEEPQALHGLADTGSEDIDSDRSCNEENMKHYSPSNSEEDSVSEVDSSHNYSDSDCDYEVSSESESDGSSYTGNGSSSDFDTESQESDEMVGSTLDQEQGPNITASGSNSDMDSQGTDDEIRSSSDMECVPDGSSSDISRSSDVEQTTNSSNSDINSQEADEEIESDLETDQTSSMVNISSDNNISSLSSAWEDFTSAIAESPTNQRRFRRNSGTRRNVRSCSPLSEDEQMRLIQELPFRERSWSLEECSICCDVMLKDQNIKTLPCTHRFHSNCILPWLEVEQQQTCPNCRKQAV